MRRHVRCRARPILTGADEQHGPDEKHEGLPDAKENDGLAEADEIAHDDAKTGDHLAERSLKRDACGDGRFERAVPSLCTRFFEGNLRLLRPPSRGGYGSAMRDFTVDSISRS
jgi:hypothetical protein